MRCYLGLDLGTSGLKGVVVDAQGVVRSEAEAAYDVSAPRPGWAETDPRVWSAAWHSVRQQLTPAFDGLTAVSVAGQMHGVVLTDGAGEPVRPAVLWPDSRSNTELGAWRGLGTAALGRLSNPIVPGMPGPTLRWLAGSEPEALARTRTVRSPKDWLRAQLTGDSVSERSDASATLLWDVEADAWSAPAVRLARVSLEQLPEVRHSADVVGAWRGVPVAAGAADVAAAVVGVTAAVPPGDPSTLVVNVGTGIQVAVPGVSPRPRLEPPTHLFADAGAGWYEMVGVRNGGLALTWVMAALRLDWSSLVAAAAAAGDNHDVVFVPFLTGERGHVAPTDPGVGWVGAGPVAARARAAFEALGFTVRRALEVIGGGHRPVLLTGGVVRDPQVRQWMANCVGGELTHVPLRSASAVGAAVLAAESVGDRLRLPARAGTVVARGSGMEARYARWRAAVAEVCTVTGGT